mmetsp:Transcript_113332/g.321113  ORF Transcript_113332/g.321113 Transcript_113332/m.321113 type:complete len:84 (-) Transcript_113332:46-297(-)
MVATHSFAKFPNSHLAVPPHVRDREPEMTDEEKKHAKKAALTSNLACGAYPTVTFPNDHLVTRKSRAGFARWACSVHGDSDSD